MRMFTTLTMYRMCASEDGKPSVYMTELTRYLSVNMNSVLLGLPTEIKELIYFDALSHAANMILVRVFHHFDGKKYPCAITNYRRHSHWNPMCCASAQQQYASSPLTCNFFQTSLIP
jgi:hypothetical protein